MANNKEYTAQEIIHQAQIVLTMVVGMITTDMALKAFLFNLALLNSMAHKGYMALYNTGDRLIYAVKQVACEWLATNFGSRCRYDRGYRDHSSVLYIYNLRRQYSFHVDLLYPIEVPRAKLDEWDGIEGGWSLSDEAYAAALAAKHNNLKTEVIHRTETEEFREMLKLYKAAREYIRISACYNTAVKKFWDLLEAKLPASKKKNKCYVTHDLEKCRYHYFDLVKDDFSAEGISFFPKTAASYYDLGYEDQIRVRKIAKAIEEGNLSLPMLKERSYFQKHEG